MARKLDARDRYAAKMETVGMFLMFGPTSIRGDAARELRRMAHEILAADFELADDTADDS